MGGNSCSKGRGFESHHRILDGHFSPLFALKDENKWKRELGWPLFPKKENCVEFDARIVIYDHRALIVLAIDLGFGTLKVFSGVISGLQLPNAKNYVVVFFGLPPTWFWRLWQMGKCFPDIKVFLCLFGFRVRQQQSQTCRSFGAWDRERREGESRWVYSRCFSPDWMGSESKNLQKWLRQVEEVDVGQTFKRYRVHLTLFWNGPFKNPYYWFV